MSVVTGVHLIAAVIAAATTGYLWLRTERPFGATRYLLWASAGTVVWTLSVASVKAEGLHPWHQVLWLPVIAFCGGAFLIWAGTFSRYGWQPPRALVAMWLGVPAAMLALRVGWGLDSRDPLFVFNTVYSFGVLVVATVWVAQRANDPAPAVRHIARGVLASAVGILVAEAFLLNVTDVVAAVLLLVLALATVRAADELRVRPSPDVLIDDLGALLFVFDQDQRLVDLNAPARLFYTLRGASPPDAGSSGEELLGSDLAGIDTVTVVLDAGEDSVRFSGYVQRLPSHGSPSRGWVCLLRRSAGDATEEQTRSARLAVMNRLPAYDPSTRVLSARAFDQALTSASSFDRGRSVPASALVVEAADAGTLSRVARTVADAWEDRLETIAVGRCGELRLGLVARDVPESSLRSWSEQVLDGAHVRLATRSGTIESASDLVDDALAELTRDWRRRPTS
ncbi:hypothetical protein [Nocardioides lijunqiniae]|uniref:hypothetical protein n=1 Tax=Nocardioides lijunqiniae TaxID=2760832 RepID=UPI0018785DC1|nr:hypothetical protein [Nocardioides lijunqiniae]